MSIIKTTQAASPSDKYTSIYMDKVTSQLYILAQTSKALGNSKTDFTLWDVSEGKPKLVLESKPLNQVGYCPVNSGEISLAIAERALGHVGEQIAELEDKIRVLKSVETSCKKVIESSPEEC